MWQTISTISTIIAIVTFFIFIGGRIWKIRISKQIIAENFHLLPYDPYTKIINSDIIAIDNTGCIFSLSSEYGIRKLTISKVECKLNNDGVIAIIPESKSIMACKNNINKDTISLQCDLGENLPTTHFELIRTDYAHIEFDLVSSGKDGQLKQLNYQCKMTFLSYLFHFLV